MNTVVTPATETVEVNTEVCTQEERKLLNLIHSAHATGRTVIHIPDGEHRGTVFILNQDRIQELAAWSQQADADLLILSGNGSGGIVVYAPDADIDAPSVYLRANISKPQEGV